MASASSTLQAFLAKRYWAPGPKNVKVRDHVESVCSRFIESRLGDTDFENSLCSGSESRFFQRFTEASLACDLLDAGFRLVPSRDGPDICIEHEGRRIWVECICPEPEGVPSEWFVHKHGQVYEFPHVAMLLRWTAAIKEKAEKLLGGPRDAGYLAKGVVGADDGYVIAVNGRLLRGAFASLNGISQFPFAVEAAFAVGPYQLHIDRTTLKAVGSDHQHRPLIAKKGAHVPAYTFLDERFAPISAIWATDFDECSVVGNERALAVVHNPLALNPIPALLLPSWSEYVATKLERDEMSLDKIPGTHEVEAVTRG
jgi:type I restriction enzyme S subunit